jgi:hypothetical protein
VRITTIVAAVGARMRRAPSAWATFEGERAAIA